AAVRGSGKGRPAVSPPSSTAAFVGNAEDARGAERERGGGGAGGGGARDQRQPSLPTSGASDLASAPAAPVGSGAAATAPASASSSESKAAGGGGARHFFTPVPMAGPRPALARGGWASLAASTAAATYVPPVAAAGGVSVGGDRSNGSDKAAAAAAAVPAQKQAAPEAAQAKTGADSNAGGFPGVKEAAVGSGSWWVNQPGAVLRCLREVLFGSPPASLPPHSPYRGSSLSDKDGRNEADKDLQGSSSVSRSGGDDGEGRATTGEGGASPASSALVSLLLEGRGVGGGGGEGGGRMALSSSSGGGPAVAWGTPPQQQKQPKAQTGREDYAAGLRGGALEQLSGKIRLLLESELSRGDGEEDIGPGRAGGAAAAATRARAGAGRDLGLEEFISLVEDVHRSVERTTRQRHDSLMQQRKTGREDGLGRLKERLRRLESKRGAIRADLNRLRRRMASKTERIKTLRVLADECWAEGEPSIGRDTLDNLEAMIRKEKAHLSKFRARAKELEAQGVDTEGLLSGMKEDKVTEALSCGWVCAMCSAREGFVASVGTGCAPAEQGSRSSGRGYGPEKEVASSDGERDHGDAAGRVRRLADADRRERAAEQHLLLLEAEAVAKCPEKAAAAAATPCPRSSSTTAQLPADAGAASEKAKVSAVSGGSMNGGSSAAASASTPAASGDSGGAGAAAGGSVERPSSSASADGKKGGKKGGSDDPVLTSTATAAAAAAVKAPGATTTKAPPATAAASDATAPPSSTSHPGSSGGGAGAGGGVVRFIQRDLDAAELMIRARKLDLAAREWVGVRCLLLKRATASAAAAAAAAGDDDDGGGADSARGDGSKTSSPSTAAPACSKAPAHPAAPPSCKARDLTTRTLPSELDSVLAASSGDAGLVVENPEEAAAAAVPGSGAGRVGMGWGGWDSSAGGDVKEYLSQAHTQDFLAGVMASGAWPMASASAACVVRGVSAVLSGSVAVGALYAHMQWAVGRVAVVDLDAHLATGTADILCRTLDPAFLYATIAVSDGGSASTGLGTHDHALRLLANGESDSDSSKRLTRAALEGLPGQEGRSGGSAVAVLSAALEAFRPDLVMISAGLDGRKGHPCGRGDLVAADYEWLTLEIVKMAERLCGGRVVSVLERHCVAAQADASNAAMAAEIETEAETDSTVDAPRAGLESNRGSMMEVEGGGGGGCCEGDEKGAGAVSPSSGELECLRGHIRGLRSSRVEKTK
ncbi:unnamed protein product, partial [Scytosiphon promiscuus]